MGSMVGAKKQNVEWRRVEIRLADYAILPGHSGDSKDVGNSSKLTKRYEKRRLLTVCGFSL